MLDAFTRLIRVDPHRRRPLLLQRARHLSVVTPETRLPHSAVQCPAAPTRGGRAPTPLQLRDSDVMRERVTERLVSRMESGYTYFHYNYNEQKDE